MLLSVKNIGKIKSADIRFDGITVVTGKNDTGKSTIGEILCSFFTAFSDIDYKINFYKQREVKRVITNTYYEYSHRPYGGTYKRQIDDLVSIFLKTDNNISHIDDFIRNFTNLFNIQDFNFEELHAAIERALKYSDEDIRKIIVSSVYEEALNGKLDSIYTNENAEITLKIKNNNCYLQFGKNGIQEINIPLHINSSSIYINNPFCLDNLESYTVNKSSNYFEKELIFKLVNKSVDERENNGTLPTWTSNEPVAKLRVNELLSDAAKKINAIVPGKILFSERTVYKTENNEDISVSALSTGIKSFMIIKQLLENNQLKEKDVLVLDEPEIHLHPEWQLLYAELIVLLQKEYNLTVFITTHSSTFLEAIDLYSKKYKITDKCNYYISRNIHSSNMVSFEDVTNDLSIVYKELVTPSVMLMRLRESLEVENDE